MTITGRPNLYGKVPEPVNGYEVLRGAFSLIVPEATVNLITNPSIELGTTGYTAVSSTLARSAAWRSRGYYSLKITPQTGVDSGAYYSIALTSGTTYTFSLDLYGTPGLDFSIYFADNAGSRVGAIKTVRGASFRKRISITYTAASSATHRLYVVRNAYADVTPYYTDGWQLEAKAYATSYADGDMSGYIPTISAYYWTGTPHASTSGRIANTRDGGREVWLNDYGFQVIGVSGLGMAPMVNWAMSSVMGGGFYQNTIPGVREWALVGSITGTTYQELRENVKGLIDIFRPDVIAAKEPVIINYYRLDPVTGQQIDEVLRIPSVYNGGLEGGTDNYHQQRVAIRFYQLRPEIINPTMRGQTLNLTSMIDGLVIWQDKAGNWTTLGFSPSNAGAEVKQLLYAPDGKLYAVGTFPDIDVPGGAGIAGTRGIARYNFASSTWEAVGGGVTDGAGAVYCILYASDGTIYVGGTFTQIGGVNANRIAKFDGTNWTAMGTGAADNAVFALLEDDNGYIFAGGTFASMGGVASTLAIARWTGASWGSISCPDSITAGYGVRALLKDRTGAIYAGGQFANMHSEATLDNLAKYSASTWTAMGQPNGSVLGLTLADDGSIYAIGYFSSIGGVSTDGTARWNGAAWSDMATTGAGGYGIQYDTARKGAFAVGLAWTTISGGINFGNTSCAILFWNGSLWVVYDAYNANLNCTATDGAGDLFCGTMNGENYQQISRITTITNNGGARVYPKLTLVGPMRPFALKNLTTGAAIYFNLTLGTGEIATFDFDPVRLSFRSNRRGNIMRFVLAGSNVDFTLLPGNNVITLLTSDAAFTVYNDNNSIDTLTLLGVTPENSTDFVLYLSVVAAGGNRYISFFSDSGRSAEVARTATYTADDVVAITERNGSGITGTADVNLQSATTSIYVAVGQARLSWNDAYWDMEH